MKTIILALLATVPVLLLPLCTGAQGLERQVIGAGGGYSQTTAGALHWTAGEMAVAPRLSAAAYWGEGFHQVWTAPTVSADDPDAPEGISLIVYPNPAAGYLRVESNSPLVVCLYDLSGRPVSARVNADNTAELDLGALPAGFYFLHAFDARGHRAGVAKIRHIR